MAHDNNIWYENILFSYKHVDIKEKVRNGNTRCKMEVKEIENRIAERGRIEKNIKGKFLWMASKQFLDLLGEFFPSFLPGRVKLSLSVGSWNKYILCYCDINNRVKSKKKKKKTKTSEKMSGRKRKVNMSELPGFLFSLVVKETYRYI